MQFTKAMVDLAKEIRRHAPSDIKPSIKLANPELFNELALLFKTTESVVLRALIKEMHELAGDPWPARLLAEIAAEPMTVQVYRGQTKLVMKKTEPMEHEIKTTTRIYRGQVVHD